LPGKVSKSPNLKPEWYLLGEARKFLSDWILSVKGKMRKVGKGSGKSKASNTG